MWIKHISKSSILRKDVRCLLFSSSQVHGSGQQANKEVEEKIKSLIKKSDVTVFMKGVPSQPMCGFSNAVVQILRMHGVPFDGHNVLEDEELRQGIKNFSDWPTIPQVYFKEEFVGGCDILLQMHQNGEIIDELSKIGIKSLLAESEDEKKSEDNVK